MACFHIYNRYGILVPVMELELINAQEPRRPFGLDEFLSIYGVLSFQPLQADVLDGILSKACNFCNFLVREPICQKISGVLVKLSGDSVHLCLERYVLHLCIPAKVPELWKPDVTQPSSETQMLQINRIFVVDMHPTVAMGTDTICIVPAEHPL